jgi:glycine cleavage system H protein
MEFPEELYYTKDHEWLRLEGDDAYIGITEFAADQLGDIVFLDIPQTPLLEAGTVFGTIEAVKTVSDLFAPVSGAMLYVNPEALAYPRLVNADPYGKGWLIKVVITAAAEPGSLLTSQQYQEMTGHRD